MLDCEEHYLIERLSGRGKETGRVDDEINAINSRIAFFKENSLPTGHTFDKDGKLSVVSCTSKKLLI